MDIGKVIVSDRNIPRTQAESTWTYISQILVTTGNIVGLKMETHGHWEGFNDYYRYMGLKMEVYEC